ncbi:DinB family protein [Bacillus haimaensis]|uniref:DinB family protein n=1 Tax=Bacillus haimaensis TaxID=3160967 RepID=UPI003AA856F4
MLFNLKEAIEILERTPKTLEAMLSGLTSDWLQSNEGEDTWNVAEVVDHLIECDKTNWIPRMESILNDEEMKHFPPFDRFSLLNGQESKTIKQALQEFASLREHNVTKLKERYTSDRLLNLRGIHPEFGEVKLRELLATWVVHDLTHISQIVRVMAKRYQTDVGPWEAYLSILKNK